MKGNKTKDNGMKGSVLSALLVGLLVYALGFVAFTGVKWYQESRPYSELDTRYEGVYEINEKEFEKIPTLELGE